VTTPLGPFPEGTVETGDGLVVAGVALVDLAHRHGTPLYAYDAGELRRRARGVAEAIGAAPGGGRAAFALKALPVPGVLRVIAAQGVGADCASAGEIAAALAAGVPGSAIVVHGNAKSEDDLRAALGAGAGLVVLDGADEADRLAALCRAAGRTQDVLVRIAPGIEVDTHRHIATGHHGSKFGLAPADGAALLRSLPEGLMARGLHAHLGSQVLEPGPLVEGARWLVRFARAEGLPLEVLDVGGGLGIRYLPEDPAPDPATHTRTLVEAVVQACAEEDATVPELVVEPGRSIVGPAGITLYTVLAVKRAADGSTWVAVDGGMGDNLRVGLYAARYAPVLAARPTAPATGRYAIAGRHCESTDVVAEDVPLADPVVGDVIAVPATGAYHQSMAVPYNLFPRPAAVLIDGGEVVEVTRRETIEDLLRREA
jgi:diaminopimelate decarboxylase